MQIDWVTVSAQVVNFLVLVYLLRRFLYQPVLQVMSQRKQNLAELQRNAEQETLSARRLARHYEDKQRELETHRIKFLDHAKQEVESQRSLMLGQLREEIDQRRRTWQSELLKEQASVIQEIKFLIGEKIARISRQVLRDLAGIQLERQIVRRFIEQLTQLSGEETKKLVQALMCDGKVTVGTSFAVSQKDRRIIEENLSRLQPGLDMKFEQRPEIVCGIVLETSGQIWPWSVGRYLDQLEEAFAGIVTPSEITPLNPKAS